ncbi:hypothetical protein CR152_32080 [Massilia violaceinigra]|uniref:Bacteriophage T5 Orf172 DNA-binding domain-containing protein n=1 Tax=Massilia violaceinigra TaxID=2045208 RepID=A0A2D2DUI6_9BURK|nr:hypothetical protein CR152_32080 [Massilia violaceinigra]
MGRDGHRPDSQKPRQYCGRTNVDPDEALSAPRWRRWQTCDPGIRLLRDRCAFVKIGKTTGQPGSRIAGLQTGCPYPMTLAAHEPGGIKEEFALHRRFAAQRVRADGEWFHNEGPLRAYVQALAVKKIPAGTVNP